MNAKKVVIDCDPGIDDVLALLLALRSPELDVLGITVVCGNVPTTQGAENALKILSLVKSAGCARVSGGNKTSCARLCGRYRYPWCRWTWRKFFCRM